jgi:hypothetical protein
MSIKHGAVEKSTSANIYSKVSKLDLALRAIFITLALVFVVLYPAANFPGWVTATMVTLGVVAALTASVRWGMQLENPSRQ